jgi:hypothetical protein
MMQKEKQSERMVLAHASGAHPNQTFKYQTDNTITMVREQDYDAHLLEPSKDICKECMNWKDFKEKCWYFWNSKKECSQKIKV